MAAVAPDPSSDDFAARIQAVQAKLARSVARAGLKDDAYAHVIEAQSAVLGELVTFVNEVRQVQQPAVVLNDQQVNDIGRRLLGSCQTWSAGLVKASLWRSWATLAATVLVAAVLGFGAGWLYRGPAQIIAGVNGGTPRCDDQQDGSRLCWIPVFERAPLKNK